MPRTREELASLGLTDDEIDQELESQTEDEQRQAALEAGEEGAEAGNEGGEGQQQTTEGSDGQQPDDPAAAQAAQAESQRQLAEAQRQQAAAQPKREDANPDLQPAVENPAEQRAARTKEIGNQLDELATKFDNAELTAAEYRAATKPLEAEQRELERQAITETTIQQIRQEETHRQWTSTVHTFLAEHPQYAPGSKAYDILNDAVIRAQNAAIEAGQGTMTKAILDAAHAEIQEAFGQAPAPKPADPAAAQQTPAQPKTAQQERKAPVVPPTLGGIPKGGTEDVQVGEFAHLDRLAERPNPDDPEAYERALAKMPREARDRYLASA